MHSFYSFGDAIRATKHGYQWNDCGMLPPSVHQQAFWSGQFPVGSVDADLKFFNLGCHNAENFHFSLGSCPKGVKISLVVNTEICDAYGKTCGNQRWYVDDLSEECPFDYLVFRERYPSPLWVKSVSIRRVTRTVVEGKPTVVLRVPKEIALVRRTGGGHTGYSYEQSPSSEDSEDSSCDRNSSKDEISKAPVSHPVGKNPVGKKSSKSTPANSKRSHPAVPATTSPTVSFNPEDTVDNPYGYRWRDSRDTLPLSEHGITAWSGQFPEGSVDADLKSFKLRFFNNENFHFSLENCPKGVKISLTVALVICDMDGKIFDKERWDVKNLSDECPFDYLVHWRLYPSPLWVRAVSIRKVTRTAIEEMSPVALLVPEKAGYLTKQFCWEPHFAGCESDENSSSDTNSDSDEDSSSEEEVSLSPDENADNANSAGSSMHTTGSNPAVPATTPPSVSFNPDDSTDDVQSALVQEGNQSGRKYAYGQVQFFYNYEYIPSELQAAKKRKIDHSATNTVGSDAQSFAPVENPSHPKGIVKAEITIEDEEVVEQTKKGIVKAEITIEEDPPVYPGWPADCGDFLLISADNYSFPVSKGDLKGSRCRESPVFKALLSTDYAENKKGRVETTFNGEVVVELLKYLYGDEFTPNMSVVAEDLYVAADYYSLDALKNLCANEVGKKLSFARLNLTLTLANDIPNSQPLKDKCVQFIWKNHKSPQLFLGMEDLYRQFPGLSEEIRLYAAAKSQKTRVSARVPPQ